MVVINPCSIIFNLLPVVPGKIVFSNFNGRGYGCNPKYITEELLRRDLNSKIIWISKYSDGFPAGVKVVKWGTLRAMYEWSTANIIVNNVRMGGYFKHGYKKKERQVYIQTWHGSMGIKKMEADCDLLPEIYVEKAKLDSKNIDFLISNCKWLSNKLRNSFYYKGVILEWGSPRNDILFDEAKMCRVREKVFNTLNIFNKKICLLMPTFRDFDQIQNAQLNIERLKNKLKQRFGGEWIVLTRSHPARQLKLNNKDCLDVAYWADPQELLVVADCLITDYSSAAFDYLYTNRPTFCYVPDYNDYINKRGLYFSLKETPFPMAFEENELHEQIEKFDNNKYLRLVQAFIDKQGSFDAGKASKLIVDLIYKILTKGN